jgi:hypothetical protein
MQPDTANAASVATTASATTPTQPSSPPSVDAISDLLKAGAQHVIRNELTLRKEEVAWSFGNLARMARQAAVQLRQQHQESAAQVTERAAEQLEQASVYLHQKNFDQFVADLEDFAHQQPALFIAGSLALGIAAARFIKSTSQPPQS